MFKRLLIANRGEIACRIARTARQMGIATIAVYSDIDRDALYVKQCDQSFALGDVSPKQSYLDMDIILSAAKQCDARAIHPGYGFLAENPAFAERCQQAGMVFIGPTPQSIRLMGSKSAARKSVAAAGLPLLPGYDGDQQDPAGLQQHADDIGYPLLIKAVAGGGGKGMRVVESRDDFYASLAAVKRESASAFGDHRVMLEKFLTVARHIEIQIFADQYGNFVHLFERDCSMQRRRQKVIEEAPAAAMTQALRNKMAAAAVQCARAIGYVGAGTVEFLLAPNGEFYFMEMNTRLQVEHPVTEMVSGQDLVEWQIRVADGQPLPCAQSQLSLSGHAVEARIYAENPDRQFLPASGRIHFIQQPHNQAGVRVDSGIQTGDTVSPHYDPMISKLIVWGRCRSAALQKMDAALAECKILGVQSNIAFLRALTTHAQFQQGNTDTRFIDTHYDELTALEPVNLDHLLALACGYELVRKTQSRVQSPHSGHADKWSPWSAGDGWQNNLIRTSAMEFAYDDRIFQVDVEFSRNNPVLWLPSGACAVEGEMPDRHHIRLKLNGQSVTAVIAGSDNELMIHYAGRSHRLELIDRRFQGAANDLQAGTLTAPMPGLVVAVEVAVGDRVSAGTPLLIIEAMKMEHLVKSPKPGIVREINHAVGDQVRDGDALLVIE